MTALNFTAVMDVIFRHEGGFVNHPDDPGGATNMGITKRTLENWLGRPVSVDEVRTLPKETARAIYRSRYWDMIRGDELPAGLDLVAMDGAVNSGTARGAKWLQTALGVAADGVIGPKTISAAQAADATAIDRAIDARMAFLRRLKTWQTFGKGWTRRLDETRAEAKAMFLMPPTHPIDTPVYHDDPAERGGWLAALVALVLSIIGRGK